MVISPFLKPARILILLHVTDGRLLPKKLGIRYMADRIGHLRAGTYPVGLHAAPLLHRMGHGINEPHVPGCRPNREYGRRRWYAIVETYHPASGWTLGRNECNGPFPWKKLRLKKKLLLTRPWSRDSEHTGSSSRTASYFMIYIQHPMPQGDSSTNQV